MLEVGLTGFLSALAQSVAGDVVAKDKLNSQKHLLDEDITRLAESAAFIWNKTVEEYKGQEHDLVSEFLGAEPDPLALVAASLATDAGIPSVFLLRVQQLARGKLRRPGDPDGKCCPVRYSFTIPESMAQILARRPFERGSGDRVGKYHLVALVDSARMHDTWLAISASEPEKTIFVRCSRIRCNGPISPRKHVPRKGTASGHFRAGSRGTENHARFGILGKNRVSPIPFPRKHTVKRGWHAGNGSLETRK